MGRVKGEVILPLCIIFVVLVSGCVGQTDITPIVKALPEVQEFLKDHPNANIRIVFWDNVTTSQNIDQIRSGCGQEMGIKSYWKVDIIEENIKLLLWLDGETKQLLCALKEGTGVTTTTLSKKTTTTTAATTTSTTASSTTTTTTTSTTTTTNQQNGIFAPRGQEGNCAYARLSLDTFNYDRTNGQLVFIVNNNGKIGLENFTLYTFNSTGIDQISLATDSRVPNKQNSTLQPGEPRSYIVNGLGNDLTRFKVVSQCTDYGSIDQELATTATTTTTELPVTTSTTTTTTTSTTTTTYTEKNVSITVPPGGAYCSNNLINVVVMNTGANSSITQADLIIVDVDRITIAIGAASRPAFTANPGEGRIAVQNYNCGVTCVVGVHSVRIGTNAGVVETTAVC